MKHTFDSVSIKCSRITTRAYSTSFSIGIYLLSREFRDPVYSIYGFVRFADEIADSFSRYEQRPLLEKFRDDTYDAIANRISLNPVLNAFQHAVHKYRIERPLIEAFFGSMFMDLERRVYNRKSYDTYILGSAEVVGLMCLRVFCNGDAQLYKELKPAAMKLGAAFQKVNFLRDLKADYEELGRTYFPGINLSQFSAEQKRQIEKEIEADFAEALEGIARLPRGARRGVYVAHVYYKKLFDKIKSVPPEKLLQRRVRVPNALKLTLMLNSLVRLRVNTL